MAALTFPKREVCHMSYHMSHELPHVTTHALAVMRQVCQLSRVPYSDSLMSMHAPFVSHDG